jgi:hypothetical protein
MLSRFVEDVKAYALDHYNQDGWDFIVETFEDAELSDEIGRARTAAGAIRKVKELAQFLDRMRQEHRGASY